ncbi:hypothetical protein HYW36_02770 [Candidatus Saccharibacteria bacterium]|nr:hypothetical protein [Candidatus Saccharibacteria bacterium]
MKDRKEIIRQAVTYRHNYNAEDKHIHHGHALEKVLREAGQFAIKN